jgi:signal transduction histidine kinase
MEEIRQIVDTLQRREAVERSKALEHWQTDLRLARWITGAGAILNLILVIIAVRLVLSDMRRRNQQATDLQNEKVRLEAQVESRTQELAELSTHLQETSEQEKYALSRELHDELGGLLVAARMDLSWLQRKLPTVDPDVLQRFKRIQESLTDGVNLKRRVVEELRPTLLDNMGLFAALRWQLKETSTRAGIKCSEKYPDDELQIMPRAAIGIFRTVQEALTNILKHADAKNLDLAVDVLDDDLVIQISDDGKGLSADRLKSLGSHGLASMRHRINSLGGRLTVGNLPSCGTIITARIPLANVLLQPNA